MVPPGTLPLEYGESSLTGVHPEAENNADSFEEHDALKLCKDEPSNTGFEPTIHEEIDRQNLQGIGKEQKKRKSLTALYVDEKRKQLEKCLSSKQEILLCYNA